MPLHYLLGPVGASFAEQGLNGPREAVTCLAFNADGDADIKIAPTDTWEQIHNRLSCGWQPDLLVLNLPFVTVPPCFWSAPLPRVALASDWPLVWHYYRRRLRSCDLVLTDTPGAEVMAREGLSHVQVANLCGCERAFAEAPFPEGPRDIDILFVGNLNPAVQRERMPWLARLARLGKRWRVAVRTSVHGDNYRRLLSRARIVFQFSTRGKCGRRSFEAAHAGALIFQEAGNRELPAYFRDCQECVEYHADDLERLLDYYLEHEDQRRQLAEAARRRAQQYRFEDFWQGIVDDLEADWPALRDRAGLASTPDPVDDLLTRAWQALGSNRFEDTFLIRDLERAVRTQPDSAVLANALGVMLCRQAQGRSSAAAAAHVAAGFFRRAAAQPGFALAGLNLAEALDLAGQRPAALDAARQALDALDRGLEDTSWSDGIPLCRGFDVMRMEWERAAWSNAGRADDEARAKRFLVGWRLHTLLAQWTGEPHHAFEAAVLRSDLPATQAALGAALARGGRQAEAVPHLRQALAGNALDRGTARALFQALGASGNRDGQRQLIEDRRLLNRAARPMVPSEAWFAEPRPKANELVSVVVFCGVQAEHTRRCLESLLRHTRPPYELVLIEQEAGADMTAYLEALPLRPGPARVEVVHNASRRASGGCQPPVEGGEQGVDTPRSLDINPSELLAQALARSRGPFIAFVKDDTVLTPGWLEGLVAGVLHDWPNVALAGPTTNAAPKPQGVAIGYRDLAELNAFAAGRRRTHAGKMLPVPRLAGSCLLARRDALEMLGVFAAPVHAGFLEEGERLVRQGNSAHKPDAPAKDDAAHKPDAPAKDNAAPSLARQACVGIRLADGIGERALEAGFRLVLVQDVFVHHLGETSLPAAAAVAALSPPQAAVQPARPKVSLCMIVRDEEKNLPDCLRSVEGLFDEIVVVDTGSTDATRDVARRFGARVFDFPWPDSFGAARNESLRHATGTWVLWLDADDRLDADNRERLRKLLAGLGDEPDAYAVKVRSVLDAGRTAFRLLDQVRLFRNHPDIRWDYRIHEQILPAVNRQGGNVRWSDVVIDHVGYQDATVRRGKLERNLHLLELDHAERSDDAFTLFNLGWTLSDLGRTADALVHLQRSLDQSKPTSSILRKLYQLLAATHRQLGDRERARTVCREGRNRFSDDIDLLFEEGLQARDQGELAAAETSWLHLLEVKRGKYFASEEVGLRGYKTRQLLAEIYRKEDRQAEAEVQWRVARVERPEFEPAWQGLGELYLRQTAWLDLDELLADLERRQLTPARVGWLRARAEVQRKEFAAARQTLARVIADDPQASGPRVLLSQVLLQEGRDSAAAEKALRDVLDLDPNHAEAQHNLRILLRTRGRVRSAAPVAVLS